MTCCENELRILTKWCEGSLYFEQGQGRAKQGGMLGKLRERTNPY